MLQRELPGTIAGASIPHATQTGPISNKPIATDERNRQAAPAREAQKLPPVAFGINTTTPPPTDSQSTMQRVDDIDAIQHLLSAAQTSAVILQGNPGVGKSTLAALLYRRLLLAKQQGTPAPRYMLWLTIGNNTTLLDLITAILNGIEMSEPGLFLLKPEQQISTLLRALRRPQDNALIVLDQFDALLHPENNLSVLPTFLALLQTDTGNSRILLTGSQTPYTEQGQEKAHVRTYPVAGINKAEGVALLHARGVQGTTEELALIWQHCSGHTYTLVLFSALVRVSGIASSTLLNDPGFQALWSGDVSTNLITGIAHYLTPLQHTILRILSLFYTPTPIEGIMLSLPPQSAGYTQAIAERDLHALIGIGLVQPLSMSNGKPGFILHTLVRQHSIEHFTGDEPQDNAEARKNAIASGHNQIANYYKQLSQQQYPPRDQRTGPLDVEPLIAAIRHLCLGWRWQRACDLLFEEGLHNSMVQWGAWNTLLDLYSAMLPPQGVLLRRDEGLVASHVAMLYGRMGAYQQSQTYFEQALSAQRQINDQLGEAMTLTNQGEIFRTHGAYNLARTSFDRALELTENQVDTQLRCILLHNLGLLAQQEKEYAHALHFYTEALHLATQADNQQHNGTILTNLGTLLYEQGEHKEALALLLAALRVREILNDPGIPLLERFLVAIEQKMGSGPYAELCKEALEIQPKVFARFVP